MSEHQTNPGWIIGVAIVVLIGIGAYFFLQPTPKAPVPPPPPVANEPAPPAEPPVEINAPPAGPEAAPGVVPEPTKPARKLPELNDSDSVFSADLLSLASDGALGRWLVSDEVVRKWVAAVNAASRGELVHKHRPLKTLPGKVIVEKESPSSIVLSEENFGRYDTPVRLLVLMDNNTALRLYEFWYPRLAEAYGELGVRNQTFHQTLLKAIDQALAAPEIEGPIKLVQPSVYYKFADPKLEKLPGVQKLMIRMGPDNAARVKEKLRELKSELQQFNPPS